MCVTLMIKPSTEDQRKIHAEVNQLINGVSLLNIAAIAATGTMLSVGGNFPKEASAQIGASVSLILILACILFIGFGHFKTIRFLTSYLIYTEASNWERHFLDYYKKFGKPKFLYSETRAWLFFVLGLIAAITPVYRIGVQPLECYGSKIWIFLFISCASYFIFLVRFGFQSDKVLDQAFDIEKWAALFENKKPMDS